MKLRGKIVIINNLKYLNTSNIYHFLRIIFTIFLQLYILKLKKKALQWLDFEQTCLYHYNEFMKEDGALGCFNFIQNNTYLKSNEK